MEKSTEVQLLEVIKSYLDKNLPATTQLPLGLGDDCAFFKTQNQNLVWSQDLLLEGTHFDFSYFSPHDLGFKSLAVNLSDLASQGAKPLGFMISLGLPAHLANKDWISQFYEGLVFLARKNHLFCAGGDLTFSKSQVVVDISIIGELPANATPWSRRNVKAGDLIGLTGYPGLSHLGWKSLQNKNSSSHMAHHRHLRPEPRNQLMMELRKLNHVHGVIDTSDSLATSCYHLAKASHLSLLIDSTKLPTHPELKLLSNKLEVMLWGAEDFEILFSFPANNRSAIEKLMQQHHVPFHVIGEAISRLDTSEVILKTEGGQRIALTTLKDWSHF